MKKNYIKYVVLALLFANTSCNDEWKDEQYENFISFKAPLSTQSGVSDIYVRYRNNEKTSFKLPVIVSGSSTNTQNISVKIDVDRDSLDILNYERFQNRTDFYYRMLPNEYFNFNQTLDIKSGEDRGLLNIDFTLKDINLVEKWVLPLTIVEGSSSYVPHPRKHYKKALLRVNPFNNFSGTYGGTALRTFMDGAENETSIVKSEIKSYVVDENTIFFYAGAIDEERQDRQNYKIYARFNDSGGVTLYADNPLLNFRVNKDLSYTISEMIEPNYPYLLRKTITINNIDYNFTDYTMIPNINIQYVVKGTLSLQRVLNTQIPDEDQAIQW